MAAELRLALLGSLRITREDTALTGFVSSKAQALLCYLAVTGQPHTRQALAGLLWGEQPEDAARASLRVALANLNHLLPDQFLITRQTIAFNSEAPYRLDTDLFQAMLQPPVHTPPPKDIELLRTGIDLYQGDFLNGFYVRDAPAFEEWVLGQRERLRRMALGALYKLTSHYAARGEYGLGIEYAGRLLALEPWQEEAHQQMMMLLALDGQRSAALAQYETCRRILAEELEVEPARETQDLYEQIRALRPEGLVRIDRLALRLAVRPHNLPFPHTSFVGRDAEMARLARRLATPTTRLLTLAGPAGSGKTRLAIQAAAEAIDTFFHGVYFVPLAAVQGATGLLAALAGELKISPLAEGAPSAAALHAYLQGKQMLLVLDGFDPLRAETALLEALLDAAPGVKVLVTARERLGRSAEWALDLDGLRLPPTDDKADALAAPAVQLFYDRAGIRSEELADSIQNSKLKNVSSAPRRDQNSPATGDPRPAAVARICRLAGGLPLGIELAAAAWRVRPAASIAQEIEYHLAALAPAIPDTHAGQRNMQAVFAHSWSLLSTEECAALSTLRTMRGPFDAEAALPCGIGPTLLAGLAEKALLVELPGGRYSFHELIRYYVELRQDATPADGAGLPADSTAPVCEGPYYALHAQPAPLVGRAAEMARLQAAWESAAAGRPHLVILAGEAGIGKTRLAEELLAWAGAQGALTASARLYDTEGGLAYAPVAAWLRTEVLSAALPRLDDAWLTDIARFVPDLLTARPTLPRPGPLTESWQRGRLFEALARAVLGDGRPRLLLLDDLQWCDRETLEWLRYLLRFNAQARLLLVCTLRSEEAADSPLTTFLLDLRRHDQVTELDLGPLDPDETAVLARQVSGRTLDPRLAADLYHETEGNPLFVVETARAGILGGRRALHDSEFERLPALMAPGGAATALRDAPAVPTLDLPPTVQAVIEARLARLSPTARELVGVAATIGRAFTFDVLARASGLDEETLVRALDELWQRRILREDADAYDFNHDKLREVAYVSLSTARRRVLHRRVAEALEALWPADLDSLSAQVAAHYRRAGQIDAAIAYYRRAAQVARQVYANEEAIRHLQRAVSLLEAAPVRAGALTHGFIPDARREIAAEIRESLGDILELSAQHDEAVRTYEHALLGVSTEQLIPRSRLFRKIGKIRETQCRYDDALAAYTQAEAALSAIPRAPYDEWWQTWLEVQLDRMWPHYWRAEWAAITALANRVRPVVMEYGTPLQRGKFFNGMAMAAYRRDRFAVSEEVLVYSRASLAATREAGNLGQIAYAQFLLAVALLWRGALDEAEELIQPALAVGEKTGDVVLQTRCLTYLALIARQRDQVGAARHYCTRSLEIAQASRMAEYVAMTRANLAWIAWREGKLADTRAHATAALILWEELPLVWSFQWTALWPLIATLVAQQDLLGTLDYVRRLLDPTQQWMPESLAAELQAVLAAWTPAAPARAATHLQHALALAEELGYL